MHFESNRLPLTSLLLERRGFLEVDVGDLELRRAAIACRLAVVVLSLGVWVGGPSRGLLDLRTEKLKRSLRKLHEKLEDEVVVEEKVKKTTEEKKKVVEGFFIRQLVEHMLARTISVVSRCSPWLCCSVDWCLWPFWLKLVL